MILLTVNILAIYCMTYNFCKISCEIYNDRKKSCQIKVSTDRKLFLQESEKFHFREKKTIEICFTSFILSRSADDFQLAEDPQREHPTEL